MSDNPVQEILAAHPGRACITCSFQAEDTVVLDMLRQAQPDIPVLFLDTGYHFPETYAYRDRIMKEWHLNLVNLRAAQTRVQQESAFGLLYQDDPGRCCQLRKVEPLLKGLEDYDLWFTGLRREQSPTRAALEMVERTTLNSGHALVKANPLVFWKWNEVWAYLRIHEIEALPLYEMGYTSIGCEPCTTPPAEGASVRSGRWGGVKLECGIHTFPQEKSA
jgi:phosphoadenosine phosphosulfate reductase